MTKFAPVTDEDLVRSITWSATSYLSSVKRTRDRWLECTYFHFCQPFQQCLLLRFVNLHRWYRRNPILNQIHRQRNLSEVTRRRTLTVSIKPGDTQFTRIFGAATIARALERCSWAALVTEYACSECQPFDEIVRGQSRNSNDRTTARFDTCN